MVVISIWELAFLLGVFSIGMIVARLILRFITISFKGVEIPLGPSFTVKEARYYSTTIAAISIMVAEWVLLVVIIYFLRSI